MARKYTPLVQIASRISETTKKSLIEEADRENVTVSELIANILDNRVHQIEKNPIQLEQSNRVHQTEKNSIQFEQKTYVNEYLEFVQVISYYMFGESLETINRSKVQEYLSEQPDRIKAELLTRVNVKKR